MHRSPVRDRQKVWWVTIEEIHEGIDNIIKYGKPGNAQTNRKRN